MTVNTVTVTAGTQMGAASFTVAQVAAQYIGAVVSPLGGCPSSVNDWLTLGETSFGPGLNRINKQFYSPGQAMTTWSRGHLATDNESRLGVHVLSVVTFKDEHIPALGGYVSSIPNDGRRVVMVYAQEAEDWYPGKDHDTFIAQTIKASDAIRAAGHPNVLIFQDSAGSQYADPAGVPASGAWLVPPAHVDGYAIDCYQNQAAGKWPSKGLANYPNWLNWVKVYAPQRLPLAIAEYGLNACSGNAARMARLQQDHDYLVSAFPQAPVPALTGGLVSTLPLMWWCYWWSDCQAGQVTTDCAHQHQFTDPGTMAVWQKILAGTA